MDTRAGRSMDSHPRISRMTWEFGTPRPRASTRAPPALVVARPPHRRLPFVENLDFAHRQTTKRNLPLGAFTGSEYEHLGSSRRTNRSATRAIG
jgi:hypothetical protein